MIWPFGHFLAFFILSKTVSLYAYFGLISKNMLRFKKFQNLFGIIWQIFLENLAFIWAFFQFENLAFFETANGQFWPFFCFSEPGNPVASV
jgi:hypothetical protein